MKFFSQRFSNLLKRLDDSAIECVNDGTPKCYKRFLKISCSFMPEIREFFTIQKLMQFPSNNLFKEYVLLRFFTFLVEAIGELLNCGTDHSVLVSSQVKVLLKKLEFLLTFLVDTMRCIELEPEKISFTELGYVSKKELIEKIYRANIFTEIEEVSTEVGFFLHSFFFTTDLVKAAKMDLGISVLLKRIEIVQVKIKDHSIAVSMKLNCGIGSLRVAKIPSEVSSSSQDKSINSHGRRDDCGLRRHDNTYCKQAS